VNGLADEAVMAEVQRGDVPRLDVLFERYRKPLFNFYLRQTADPPLSEDLVQEVFYRVLRYRHTFQPESNFVTWLYQIARNARTDHFRKYGREELNSNGFHGTPSRDPLPGEALETAEEEALLKRALLRLDPEKRELLVLSRYQGMKYEQIAEMYGCNVAVIKGRVFRTIRELREIFFALEKEKRR
jgi:RNA polymerase sigma factor (sigma-70 family)